jgi:hypothetical protein
MIRQFYDKQKAEEGAFVTQIWIGAGFALILFEEEIKFLNAWNLAYFIIGPFVASIVLGSLFFYSKIFISSIISRFYENPYKIANSVRVGGCLLMILEALIVFMSADYVMRLIN